MRDSEIQRLPQASVVHCKRESYDIYIGRANGNLPQSKWANPWIIGKDGTREQVIERYESHLRSNKELLSQVAELRGKVLGCWCKPDYACHGDVLIKILNEMEESNKLVPIFTTHYSIGQSVMTLEEYGKTKLGNPVSICDLAKQHGLKQVVIVDDRIDGFIEAYKNITKAGSHLIYGIKFTMCNDMEVKNDESLDTESSIIVFSKNTAGYSDLIKLYNRAWTDGFYYRGRLDWKMLKAFWTDNLSLALPYFSSFIAKNCLTMNTIVPDLPVSPVIFKEADSGLPFAPVIDQSIADLCSSNSFEVQPIKTVYYPTRSAFKNYINLRCITNRSSFNAPRQDHLASDHFSFEDYLKLSS